MDIRDNSGYIGINNVYSTNARCGVVSIDQRYAARIGGQAHSAGPDTIANLVGWFSADSIIGVADGGNLEFWRNLVGDNHAFCTIEESKPTYYTSGGSDNNYRPYIHFGGADGSETNWLSVNDGIFTGGDLPRSMAIVYRPLTYASEQRFCGQGYWVATTPTSTSNAHTAFYFRIVSQTQSITWYSRGSDQAINTVAFSSAFHVAVLLHGTNGVNRSYNCYQDSVLVHTYSGTFGSTSGIVQSPFMFGSGFAAGSASVAFHENPFWGDICEFVAYDALLDETQRATLTSYLMTKYGVSAP